MGFFSWKCAVTGLPICNVYTPLPALTRIVWIREGRAPVHGSYDGYGHILADRTEERDAIMKPGQVLELVDQTCVWNDKDHFYGLQGRLVLEEFYSGQTFEQLKPNKRDEGQGHFHNFKTLYRRLMRARHKAGTLQEGSWNGKPVKEGAL